jgi:hypothetical protein
MTVAAILMPITIVIEAALVARRIAALYLEQVQMMEIVSKG